MPRIVGVFFNESRAGIFKDKKIREALASAVDRKELVEHTVGFGAVPTENPFPFIASGTLQDQNLDSRQSRLGFDLESAKKLLKEAGWRDENGDGILEKSVRDGKKSVVTTLNFTLVTSDWPELVKVSNLLGEMWRRVGADVKIQVFPLTHLESEVIRPRNFEVLLFGQVYGFEPDPFAFWHSSQLKDPGLNVALYTNRTVDERLGEARKTFEPEARRKKYEEISRLILQDKPAIFLYTQLYTYLLPREMQGVSSHKISLSADRFNEIHKWYLKTKRVLK